MAGGENGWAWLVQPLDLLRHGDSAPKAPACGHCPNTLYVRTVILSTSDNLGPVSRVKSRILYAERSVQLRSTDTNLVFAHHPLQSKSHLEERPNSEPPSQIGSSPAECLFVSFRSMLVGRLNAMRHRQGHRAPACLFSYRQPNWSF